jgi:hypothetical protein
MSATLSALLEQKATGEDLERLRRWSVFLRRRGACGTLDGAAQLAASLLREFPQVVQLHLDRSCTGCGSDRAVGPTAPFALEVPGVRAELLGS